jgi:hypothetical protein
MPAANGVKLQCSCAVRKSSDHTSRIYLTYLGGHHSRDVQRLGSDSHHEHVVQQNRSGIQRVGALKYTIKYTYYLLKASQAYASKTSAVHQGSFTAQFVMYLRCCLEIHCHRVNYPRGDACMEELRSSQYSAVLVVAMMVLARPADTTACAGTSVTRFSRR